MTTGTPSDCRSVLQRVGTHVDVRSRHVSDGIAGVAQPLVRFNKTAWPAWLIRWDAGVIGGCAAHAVDQHFDHEARGSLRAAPA